MKISERKKGFTLVELSVALAVTVIAMGLLSILFVTVNNFSKNKQFETELQEEVTSFRTEVKNICENFQSENFVWSVDGQSEIKFTGSDEENILIFSDGTLSFNGGEIKTYLKIHEVIFQKNNSLINCMLIYGDNLRCNIVIQKRTV